MDFNSDYTFTINGKAAAASKTMDVINPATGQAFAKAPAATVADLDAAVAAAKAAFPAWRDTPMAERVKLVVAAGEAIEKHVDEFAKLFVQEQGRPYKWAKGEVLQSVMWLKSAPEIKLPVEIAEDSDARRVEVHHVPLGVVCAIVPWNFPMLLACWKIMPALVAGNTLIVKPSPFTPLCSLKMGELFRDIFPPGVFNVLTGGDDLGPMMTAHPGFAKISFTGSTATGKKVMESAAKDLKRVTLELGGNDAAIILPDVDVDAVANQLFFGAFFNSSQICVATKRLYIHEDIYDKVRDKLYELVKGATVGDGADRGSTFGPIQNKPQYERVLNLIADAREKGLVLLEGKEVPKNGGYFIPLMLVDNPPEDSRVVVEEAFGPVLPLLKWRDEDDVIRRANNTQYGLAGAVWSKDVKRATAIAHRMETGTVWINQNLYNTPHTPQAGHKQSGLGVENGTIGLQEFCAAKAIFIPK